MTKSLRSEIRAHEGSRDHGTELFEIINKAVTDVLNRPEGLRGPYLIKNSDTGLRSGQVRSVRPSSGKAKQ